MTEKAKEMKPSIDLLAWHIMEATADDWESVDQIITEVEGRIGVQDPVMFHKVILELFENEFLELMPMTGITQQTLKDDPKKCWLTMYTKGRSVWNKYSIHYSIQIPPTQSP